jgi:hypothetical protein
MKKKKTYRAKGEFSVTYFATYLGRQRNMKLSPGVGKLIPGIPFEVTEKMANSLRRDSNFKVEKKRKYATG